MRVSARRQRQPERRFKILFAAGVRQGQGGDHRQAQHIVRQQQQHQQRPERPQNVHDEQRSQER